MSAAHRPIAPEVPLDIWRELLDAALAFRAARPWQWMTDSDVFALVDETGRPWFPTVLGAAGQVFGMALYRGENGLRFLLETAETLGDDPRAAMFAQDALLLDWGAKRTLAPEDLAVLRALGHAPKPRERLGWPCFRSHAPGWHPWFLDADEARSLARGTRALLACADYALHHPGFFEPSEAEGRMFPTVDIAAALAGPLTRERIEWRTWQLEPLPPPPLPRTPASWRKIAARPRTEGAAVEFDIVHLPSPTSDGGRPYFPRVALVVDADSGYIYAFELAAPERDWGELVVAAWTKAFAAAKSRPQSITIRRLEWEPALRPLAGELGIALQLDTELPYIDEACDSFARFGVQ